MAFHLYFILCPLIFFAGFVDAIAGGGGLISLPAYVACGLPMHNALATNKFSATFAGSTASIRFILKKKADLKIAVIAAVFALAGSSLGAKTVQHVNSDFLKYLLIVATPVIAFFVLKKKDFGAKSRHDEIAPVKVIALSVLAGLCLGFYDGFYGPGMGTFLIMFFTAVLGYDVVTASGNAKIVNLASNVAALVTFIIDGKVLFLIGLPCAVCGILGGFLGSGLAIKKGSGFIRPVFVFVLTLIVLYIANDLTGFIKLK